MKTKKDSLTDSDKSQPVASDVPSPPAREPADDSLEEALLRAKADYANLQRRAAAERAEAIRFANAELLRSILGVLDDFERTLEAVASRENLQSVVEGVELVHANLIKALQDNGLEEINALHKPFDPTIHEALLQQPTDRHPPGTVIEQVARGYRLRDRVLRPARVIVAKAPGDADRAKTETEPSETPSATDDGRDIADDARPNA